VREGENGERARERERGREGVNEEKKREKAFT
jgi:hypothetical protein